MNKKRYLIVIALIIFLFLALFTFANPFNDGEGGNPIEEIEEDATNKNEEKEEVKDTQDEEQEEIKEVVQEDNSYDLALKAVEKAEISLDEKDYDFALDLVNKVTDKEKKETLEERLDEVLNFINARELVEALVKMTKSSKDKADLDSARKFNIDNEVFDKVDDLNNEVLKETLSKSLKSIKYVLDDTKVPTINIEDGAILDSDTIIEVEDENEVTITLNGKEIENNHEVSDGVYELVVTDESFNEVKVKFTIDTIAPTATVDYSKGELTNEDVVVTLNPSEDIKVTNNDGKLEYTFTENGEFTFEFEDIAGNKGTAKVVVDYIDKKDPEATVSYSEEKLINENVVVTIEVSEEIKEVEGWTISEDKKVLTKEFTENAEGTIEIVDLAGNKITVDYSVNNIDKELPTATVTYSTEEFINGNVIATIEVSEEIKEVEGWTISADKKELTKEFTENAEGTIEIVDLAGNKITVDYNVKNIDKSFPTIKGVEDGKHYKEATPIIEDENIESIKINGINFINGTTIRLNGTFTIVATDKAGNTTEVTFTVDNINPKILLLDRLTVIRGDLIPIKPVIIDANLDKVTVKLDGEDINYKSGDQLVEPGVYEITAIDKAGNTSTTTFTMDNSGPEIYTEQEIELIPGTGITEKVDIKLSGLSLSNLLAFKEVNLKVKEDNFDPKSIIVLRKSSITLPFDYTLPTYNKIDYTYGDTITVEGEYIVLAADKALNISYAKFIIDTTKPVINNIEPNEYYKEVVVDVEDATLSTIQLQEYLLGDYRTTKFLSNGDVLTESGEYRLLATDKAGNQTTVIFNIDSKDPTITGVNDKYIYIKEVSPVISDTNLDNVIVTKDGSTIESKATYTEEGIYTITATDKANNSVTVGFEIDKDALKIENVENGKHYQTSVEPKITNRGEITIKLMKNGSLVDYTDTISEAGNYVLTVTDEYGNEVIVNFAVDKMSPTIHAEDKQVAATENGTFNLLDVIVTDDVDTNPELEVLEIIHTNGETISKDVTQISTTPDWEGTYTITYQAIDESGRKTTKTVYVIVFLSDISIELDLSSLENVYNGLDQTNNIKAYIKDAAGNVVSDDTINDIKIEVLNLSTNENFVKNAGTYEIAASVINKPTEYTYDVYQTLTYTISKKQVSVEFEQTEASFELDGIIDTNVYEYDGNNKKYIAKVKETGDVIGTYIAKDENGFDGVTPGTYNIIVKPADYLNENYELAGESQLTVTIIKATLYANFPNTINPDGTITISEFTSISGDVFTNIPHKVIYKRWDIYRYVEETNMKKSGTYRATIEEIEENTNYNISPVPFMSVLGKKYEVK